MARAASLAASVASSSAVVGVVMERSAERQMLEGQAWLILSREGEEEGGMGELWERWLG